MTLRPTDRTPTQRQLHEALDRKTALLRQMRRAAIDRLAPIDGVDQPSPPARDPEQEQVAQRAQALLNGHGSLLITTDNEIDLRRELRLDIRGLDLAIHLLEQEAPRQSALALAEWMSLGGLDRWTRNRLRLADALLAVRSAIDEAREIRSEAHLASGAPFELPGDRGDKPLLHPDAVTALEAIKAAGILR